jgi:hypothetical protein
MIRKAAPADIKSIFNLGIEALENDAYDKLVIDREKTFIMARECVSSANNFAWVAENDGVIGGAVLALVHPNMFYERSCATVVMFYCKLPGEGVRLIREFLQWSRKRPIIKLIQFTLERNADPRIGVLLKRLGLNTALPVYFEVR